MTNPGYMGSPGGQDPYATDNFDTDEHEEEPEQTDGE